MATGQTTIDFGAFPGKSDASVAVTGQTAILSGSFVEAWLTPVATADHSADEHLADPPRIAAGNIVAGTGFTIYAFSQDFVPIQDTVQFNNNAPRPYGLWTVNWAWA